uniref:Cadherin n=1 Tax=Steinernema glaseri TaxID=37863 RepID=A0A1I8AAX7_9BILA
MLLTASFIYSFLFLLERLSATSQVNIETYRVPHDAPPGWLVVDLAADRHICSPESTISIEHSKYSRLFHLSSLCRLTTNGDLKDLAGLNIPVTVMSTVYDSETPPINTFHYLLLEVQDIDSLRFENTVYATEIRSTASAGTLLEFLRPIQLSEPEKKVDFQLKYPEREEKSFINISTRIDDFGKRFAEVSLVRNASYNDSAILHRFYIVAIAEDGFHVASARIEIVVRPSGGSSHKTHHMSAHTKPSKPPRHRRDHHRRDLGNDIIIELPEGHPLDLLEQRIRLFGDERVILAPVVKDQISVGSDGSIELIAELDYEKTNDIMLSVQIEDGYGNARIQTVLVEVQDVDEPPVFLNVPRPYLAVVPFSRPIGFQVYKFLARDELGLGDADVEYRLINTEPPGMFVVDAKSGAVRTAAKSYTPGDTYQVFVQARDRTRSGNDTATSQDSEIAVLEIYAGDRPPQFFEQKYEVSVPEDTEVQNSVVKIEVHRFKPINEFRSKGPLRYSLFSESNGPGTRELSSFFDIDSETGVVTLKQSLDRDDPSQAKLHKLSVTAHEDGKESSVPLEITVEDVNDNAPTFSQPLYTASAKEDISLGEVILKVQAEDKDAGKNSELIYSIDDRNFTINSKGEISARVRLDADQNREKFFIYRFTVTVMDKGTPPLQGHAQVQIRTENTNDEAPMFMPTRQYTAFVAEDAQGGTPVLQVQAIEPDRDQITYGFMDRFGRESNENELFEIDQDTGLIRLGPNVDSQDLLKVQSPYNLTVFARDDGSCCGFTPGGVTHTSTATVLIGIADVNNNKPEFRDCDTYSQQARIEEGIYRSNPPTIIRVKATDEDSSPNGDIVYSLYYARSQSRKPFTIDPDTGDLRPSPHVIFDREQRAYEEVTVKATDKGDRPLIGFCQFTVQVVDVNDNAPQFDRASYETSISRAARPLTSVVTVYADDSDAPQNAQIFYNILSDDSSGLNHAADYKYFKIMNPNSGEITLMKSIPANKDKFIFNVLASDNGFPEALNSTVQVTVNVHEKQQSAPQWQTSNGCKQTVVVDENMQINSVLFRCHAIAGGSTNNPISYKMTNGVKRGTNIEQKFREFMEKKDGRDWVVVKNMESLDYEQTKNYTLTITATDMRTQVTSDKQFNVIVRDMNDAVPRFTVDRFTGTIDEELTPAEFLAKSNGKPITVVKAEDADSFGPQSDIRYRILGDSRFFRIDEISGGIFPLEKFDRETADTFILDVEARDSMPSSLPGAEGPNKDIVKVQIFVADVNDNAPFFNQTVYETSVPENVDVDTDLITIKASDLDKHSNLKYNIIGQNGGRIPFGIRTDSGAVFVKEPLDFEIQKEYEVKVLVTDGKHNASTHLHIKVSDINDNAPQFVQNRYETTIKEEDGNVPKVLFRLKAIDADQDEKSKMIIYRLEGQGVGEYFSVNRLSGEVNVLKALDRDPPYGVPVWKFVAQAVDDDGHGLIGYADVQVNLEDINDNAPIFPNDMFGKVDENREPGAHGVYVMTASATDYDDPRSDNSKLEYSISVNKLIDGDPVFRIDPNNGKIFAMRKLDRELSSERQFVIEVRASDKGAPAREGAGNVTITVVDVNDNYPYFEKPNYFGAVAETAAVGSAVLSVSALDDDNEAKDNVFTYELLDKDNEYFYMTTDADSSSSTVGVIRVKKPLDFEDPTQRNGFPLDVRVFDGRYYATTHVVLQLEDRNDNPPRLFGPSRVEVKEDVRYKHVLATLKVEDADANDTATLDFFLVLVDMGP